MQAEKKIKRRIFDSSMTVPLVKASAIHLVLVAAMLISFNSLQQVEALEITVPQPKTIQAKAISSADVEKLVKEKTRKENAAKRAEQDRIRRIQQEKDRKRKAEQDKKRKADQERKRKADADKKKREETERKKREEEARQQQEAERKKREEEARIKREEEARIKAEQEAKVRAAQEKRVLGELAKFTALIKSKVSRNWIVGNNTGQCVLEVKLAPGGLILNVRQISGGADLCRSAMAAVYKSDPLPVSNDPAVFAKMRTLRLDLDPREN